MSERRASRKRAAGELPAAQRPATSGAGRPRNSRARKTMAPAQRGHPAAAQQLATRLAAALAGLLLALGPAHRGPSVQDQASGQAVAWLWAEAVSVQRMNVPDLVVIDQLNQAQTNQHQPRSTAFSTDLHRQPISQHQLQANGGGLGNGIVIIQPEAASLINSQQQQHADNQTVGRDQQLGQQQPQFTFECLVSFDKRKDKNLIVKWHHDERNEPIYQWIPELNKRSIAPQYRPFIAPTIATTATATTMQQQQQTASTMIAGNRTSLAIPESSQVSNSGPNQILEAGFKLIKPSKELGGKYTCSAISSQNDDSKSKKMIVYTPPQTFRFNASRTDIGSLMASQRDRLIQLTQPATQLSHGPHLSALSLSNQPMVASNQLPLAYRMKGLNIPFPSNPTTISPQMYSTIDYVNVNQQRSSSLQQQPMPWAPTAIASTNPQFSALDMSNSQTNQLPSHQQFQQANLASRPNTRQQFGVKLICDIDQVFPVPEVSIYRLAKSTTHPDVTHPEKLPKLETKIERDLSTGLFHIQVTTIIDDDELQLKYGPNEPVQFECLMALTNLELSKYADNKRSIIYRPGSLANSLQSGEEIKFEQHGNSATSFKSSILVLFTIIPLGLTLFSCMAEFRRSHIWVHLP